MALASAPRPAQPRRIYFDADEMSSAAARDLYDGKWVISSLKGRDSCSIESTSHLTYSDALHVIVAVCQDQPLSMEFFAIKKVLELDLEINELPQELQKKAEEEHRLARLYQFF